MSEVIQRAAIAKKLKQYICAAVICLLLGFVLQNVYANPVGGQVAAGNATITSPSPNTVQINQSSNKAIINWKTFNIKSNEQTHFQQPSRSSITLNRVNPNNGASGIYGKLTSNGQVWLVNPAGIYFGPNAYVNVAGIIATTANIRDQDFMSGNYHFDQSPGWHGSIINDGKIIAYKGAIALFAPGVENNGLVMANLGQVILASGSAYTVDFYGDQLVQYQVDSKIADQALDSHGRPLKNRISNNGRIIANGGSVIMTVKVAKNILNNVINMSGIIIAKSIAQKNGEIILMAGDAGSVNVNGKLKVSGSKPGEKGGTIKILANHVTLENNAELVASGYSGGGEILIGGDYQGKNPFILNAENTFINSNVKINADALVSGNGGKVIVWANNSTQFYGNISAKGGAKNGNGGFVETSGKNYLDINGSKVDASASIGISGTWLLDPRNVIIDTSSTSCTSSPCFSAANPTVYTPDTNSSHVSVTDILNALEGGTSVTITTGTTGTQTGTIAVNTAIDKTSGTTPVTLTLDSSNGGGTITINNQITSTVGVLNVSLNSGNAITIRDNIITNGGDLLSTSQNATNLSSGVTITTGSGSVTFNANASGVGGQDFIMNAASTINTSNSPVVINVNEAGGGTGQATLGNISTTGGSLAVTTNVGGNTTGSSIVQAGSSTLSVGSANLSTGNGAITLTNNNDFTGPVTITTNTAGKNVAINDINDLQLGQISMPNGSGTLTINSDGAITQEGSTTINSGTGLSSFDSGVLGASITLTNNNVFNGAVALTSTGSSNDVSLVNIGDLSLDNISVGGNLSVSASNGSISQAAAARTIVVAGTSNFVGTGSGDAITLANNGNQFTGAVSLTNSGANNVSVNNSIPFILGAINVGNNLTVTTVGAGSSISQVEPLIVPGAASFDAGANAITLTNNSNNVGGVLTLANSGANDVAFTNSTALEIGASSIGQNLTLIAAGNITESGAITASSGTTTLSVTIANADILLASQANDFGASSLVFGGVQSNIRDVAIKNINAGATVSDFSGLTNLRNLTLNFTGNGITLPALTLHNGGNLDVTAKGVTGGAINQSGSLVIPGTSSFTTTTGTSGLRTINLTDASNQFVGAVSLTNSGTGTVNIQNSILLQLSDVSLGSGAATMSGEGITQYGVTTITASGTLSLFGNTGAIDLTNTGNNISDNVSASNTAVNNVNINNSTTLKLANFSLVGSSNLTVNAPGVTQVAGNSIVTETGNITLNAGTGTLTTGSNNQIFTTGSVTLIADHMTLSTAASSQIGGTSLGVGSAYSVILAESTPSTSIGVAGGAGTLSLGQSELNNIFATNVRIGNADAGTITVNTGAVWVPHVNFANNGVLTFNSGDSINQGGGIDLSTNGASLLFRDATSVDFTNANNNISNIAANVTGSISIVNNTANPLTVTSLVDDLGSVNGVSASGTVSIATSGTGGLLTINNDINSGNNNIILNSVGITQADNTNINAGSGAISIDAGGGAMQFNTGALSTTNASSAAVSIQNGTTVALGNITANSGTIVLGVGDISGEVTQNPSTVISANVLTANTTSSINLSNTANTIAQLGEITRGGAFTFSNTGTLAINGSISAGTVTNPVLVTTSGALTLSPGITITADITGDAVVMAAQSFTNNAGTSAFNTGSGRFLVWSQNPANDDRGGLIYNFKQYNAAYGVTTVLGSGNGFLYTIAPTITASLTGTSTKIYDATLTGAPLTVSNYSASSGIDGDTVTLVNPLPVSGTYATENVGSGIEVTVSGLTNANISATDGAAIVYGYQLSSTDANGNIGIIQQRPITLIPSSLSRAYGDANPTSTTSFTVGGLGLAGSDSISAVGVNSPATLTSNVGAYDLTSSSIGTIFSSGLASNYAITNTTIINGLNVTPAPLTITANNQTKSFGVSFNFSGTEFSSNGLKNNQTIGSVVLTSLGASASASIAGSPYRIIASNATGGTFTATNYSINYVDGSLTVVSSYIPPEDVMPYNNIINPASQSLYGLVSMQLKETMESLKFSDSIHGNCEIIAPNITLCPLNEKSSFSLIHIS